MRRLESWFVVRSDDGEIVGTSIGKIVGSNVGITLILGASVSAVHRE